MKKILITVVSHLLPIIGCQLISIYYASNKGFLGPLFKTICFNIAYNLFLTYFSKSDDKSKEARQKLNSWIFYVYSIVLISWVIEYTSKFYAQRQLAQFMLSSAKSGVPSLQVYGWRCSGAYYFETYCDLESNTRWLEKEERYFLKSNNFTSGLIGHHVFNIASSGKRSCSTLWSGYSIDCTNNHASKIKREVKRNSWDGPQPVHVPGQDCTCGKGEKVGLLE